MKREIIIGVLLLTRVFLSPSPADDLVKSQPLYGASQFPRTLLHRMPRGDKSLCRGFVKPTGTKDEIALHLFSHSARPPQRDDDDHLTIDIWKVTFSGKNKIRHYKHTLRTALSYRYSLPPDYYGIQFAWLDPQTRKIPVLLISLSSKGENGVVGSLNPLVFTEGWGRQPCFQNFSFDTGAGSGAVDTMEVQLESTLDDHGYIQFSVSTWHPPDGDTVKTLWQWEDKQFKAGAVTTTPFPAS